MPCSGPGTKSGRQGVTAQLAFIAFIQVIHAPAPRGQALQRSLLPLLRRAPGAAVAQLLPQPALLCTRSRAVIGWGLPAEGRPCRGDEGRRRWRRRRR